MVETSKDLKRKRQHQFKCCHWVPPARAHVPARVILIMMRLRCNREICEAMPGAD